MVMQKSPDVIVLSEEAGGYRIIKRNNKHTIGLDHLQAQAWFDGNLNALGDLLEPMIQMGVIQMADAPPFFSSGLDNLIPKRVLQGIRFYLESPELTILFNTCAMREENPLLVLGPYASVLWQGIVHEETIGEIRKRALRLFGTDEVIPFLARLMSLGFLLPLKSIQETPPVKEVIVKEFFAPEIQFMMRHSRVPWYCLWEINTECDTRCQICYLREYQNPGPQAQERDGIIEQIDQMGIFYVTLLGGEALLRKDLEEIILRLRRANIFVKLITNGHLLTAQRATSLVAAGLNEVEISFDGITALSHERSRVRGSFGAAQEALRVGQECGIPRVGMVLTVYSQNFQDLYGLPAFMREHHVRECYLSLFRKTGLMGGRSSITPISADELLKAQHLTRKWRKVHPDLTIALLPDCTCGRTSVVIGADNTLRPCPSSYDSAMGNLLETPLMDIWARIGEQARTGILWCKPSDAITGNG